MSISKNYFNALKNKYVAEKSEAYANLVTYLSDDKLSAIGEHSDLLSEQDKWLSKWSEANDKLENLNELFLDNIGINSKK